VHRPRAPCVRTLGGENVRPKKRLSQFIGWCRVFFTQTNCSLEEAGSEESA
jgi:hypothetical protein